MQVWTDFHDSVQQEFVSIVNAVVKIQYTVCRTVGYQNIGIGRNDRNVACLAVGYAVIQKHRYAVEPYPVYLDAGIAKIMNVSVQTLDVGSIEAFVMIAADENLVL